jgi:hypothetical protein
MDEIKSFVPTNDYSASLPTYFAFGEIDLKSKAIGLLQRWIVIDPTAHTELYNILTAPLVLDNSPESKQSCENVYNLIKWSSPFSPIERDKPYLTQILSQMKLMSGFENRLKECRKFLNDIILQRREHPLPVRIYISKKKMQTQAVVSARTKLIGHIVGLENQIGQDSKEPSVKVQINIVREILKEMKVNIWDISHDHVDETDYDAIGHPPEMLYKTKLEALINEFSNVKSEMDIKNMNVTIQDPQVRSLSVSSSQIKENFPSIQNKKNSNQEKVKLRTDSTPSKRSKLILKSKVPKTSIKKKKNKEQDLLKLWVTKKDPDTNQFAQNSFLTYQEVNKLNCIKTLKSYLVHIKKQKTNISFDEGGSDIKKQNLRYFGYFSDKECMKQVEYSRDSVIHKNSHRSGRLNDSDKEEDDDDGDEEEDDDDEEEEKEEEASKKQVEEEKDDGEEEEDNDDEGEDESDDGGNRESEGKNQFETKTPVKPSDAKSSFITTNFQHRVLVSFNHQ